MGNGNGVRLDDYLRQHGQIPYAKVARIAAEVLAQIRLIASRGENRLLSGINPGRILVSASGQVALLPPEDDLPVTAAAPAYASPEEVRGAAPDVRTACYSLGCTLFELLTGQPPFPGDDAKKVLRGHLAQAPPDVGLLRPEMPAGLASLIHSLLEKDPERRAGEPSAVIARLQAALGVAQPPAKPVSQRAAASVPRAIPRPAAPASRPAAPNPSPRPAQAPAVRPAASRAARPAAMPPKDQKGSWIGSVQSLTPLPGTLAPRGAPVRATVKSGRYGAKEKSAIRHEIYIPPPRKVWLFSLCGGGLGLVIALVLATQAIMKMEEPPPMVIKLSKDDEERVRQRREKLKRDIEGDQSIASREFERLNRRLSFDERIRQLGELLSRYPHTEAATGMTGMAQMLTELRTARDEAASGEVPLPPEGPVGEGSEPEPPPPPVSPGVEPASAGEKSEAEKKPSKPDDIGVQPGGDDGKTEL